MKINQNFYQAYYYLGNISVARARLEKLPRAGEYYEQAIDYYKKALQIKPGLIEIINSWGNTYESIDLYKVFLKLAINVILKRRKRLRADIYRVGPKFNPAQ